MPLTGSTQTGGGVSPAGTTRFPGEEHCSPPLSPAPSVHGTLPGREDVHTVRSRSPNFHGRLPAETATSWEWRSQGKQQGPSLGQVTFWTEQGRSQASRGMPLSTGNGGRSPVNSTAGALSVLPQTVIPGLGRGPSRPSPAVSYILISYVTENVPGENPGRHAACQLLTDQNRNVPRCINVA